MKRGKARGVLLCGVAALLALAGAGWVLRDVLWAGWWVLRLEHGDLETRRRAVEELGRRPAAFAIPHLVEAASEEALRAAVHESLVRSGHTAVPRLVEALSTAAPEGRRAAAEALRKMEIERAARIEVEAWFVAEGAGPEKTEALRALSRIGPLPDSAIDLIATELDRLQPSSSDYITASMALEAQGPRSERALPVLFECLLYENAYYPLRAIVAVGAPAGALLEKELSSEDPNRRMSAAQALVSLGGPSARKAVPVLIAALKDPAQHARGAAQSLGLLGPDAREAAPALIEALGDPAWDVSFYASQALGSLGSEAVPALVKLLGSPGNRRRRLALGALEEMESEALWAGRALRDALEDGEPGIRTRAATILAKLGFPADLTLPHLLAGLDSTESHVKRRAREGIEALVPRASECRAPLRALLEASLADDEVKRWSLSLLERVEDGSETLERTLEAVVAANPYDIDSAGALLQVRSSPANIQRFLEHLRSPYRKVRLAALWTIREKRITVPEVVAEVVSILEQPEVMKDAGRRAPDSLSLFLPALQALEAMGPDSRPGARALEMIVRTGTSEQRIRAAGVLHAIEPRPALVVRCAIEILEDKHGWSDNVQRGYRGSATPRLFAEAARLVGSLGAAGAEAEVTLRAALEAESFTTRVAAACALWRLTGKADESLAVFLQDAGKRRLAWFERPASILDWGGLGYPDVAPEMRRVLAEMGRPAVEALVPFLDHEHHEARAGACRRLADMGDAALSALPALCARLRDRDFRVALAASDAIEQLQPEDLGPIVALLGDFDPSAAVRAGRLLLRLRGTQALPEVQTLLGREDTREPVGFLLEALEPGTGTSPRRPSGRIRSPPESVETLLSRLADPSMDVRLRAMEELGRLGPAAAAAVPVLLQAIDDEAAAEEAIRALGRIRSDPGRAVPALVRVFKVEALRKHHEEAEGALIAYGSEAVPFVVPELRAAIEGSADPFYLSWFALLERAGPSSAAAVPDLCRAVPALENSWYREHAVRVLGAIGPAAAEAVPRLEEVIRNTNEPTSMLGAAWVALERIRGKQR